MASPWLVIDKNGHQGKVYVKIGGIDHAGKVDKTDNNSDNEKSGRFGGYTGAILPKKKT
jgi:hypothetical protein